LIMTSAPKYYLYMLECSDSSIYTGIAIDVLKRFEKHCNGKGSKYVRSRLPAKIVWTSEPFDSRGEAQKAEWRVKQLSRRKKLEMISE